jgi:hypothetical protein
MNTTRPWFLALWCALLWLITAPAQAQVSTALVLGQTVQGVADFKAKRFMGDLELRLPLPEGSWTVRHISPVKSTHSVPSEGLMVMLDRVASQRVEGSLLLRVYPSDNKNWNAGDLCFGRLLSRERGTALSGYCHSLKSSSYMTNTLSDWQAQVRKSWNEVGTQWPTRVLNFDSASDERGRFSVAVSYAIAFPAMGLPNELNVAVSTAEKMEAWWRDNSHTDGVRQAIAWYEAYSAQVYEAVKGSTPVVAAVSGSVLPPLRLAVKDMSAALPDLALAAPASAAQPAPPPQASAQRSAEMEALRLERERLAAEAAAERARRQELEQRLQAAQAQERDRAPVPVAPIAAERRVALVVGNSAYKSAPLQNPRHDAADMSSTLRALGFDVTTVQDASLRQLREATRRFEQSVASADVALIFYAGHAVEAKGRNYLIPVDADVAREYELDDQAYDAQQWLAMLGDVQSRNTQRVNIVILDACRDNPMSRQWRSASRGLGRMDAPSGTLLVYSTAPGKVASDGPKGQRNSPFTKSLLQAMQTPNVPVEQVLKDVRRRVLADTQGEQVPWENSSLVGDFVFKRER